MFILSIRADKSSSEMSHLSTFCTSSFYVNSNELSSPTLRILQKFFPSCLKIWRSIGLSMASYLMIRRNFRSSFRDFRNGIHQNFRISFVKVTCHLRCTNKHINLITFSRLLVKPWMFLHDTVSSLLEKIESLELWDIIITTDNCLSKFNNNKLN